ncbi:unnamed protein product [Dovyalis caffra]|uniref:Uncharacterized protein n=1 Tax=Dovyalis caffra TaxID=77055 RepID=A0AAV1RMH0_9ROSI|nr:unnamed protein product [Dovyalis caffra]
MPSSSHPSNKISASKTCIAIMRQNNSKALGEVTFYGYAIGSQIMSLPAQKAEKCWPRAKFIRALSKAKLPVQLKGMVHRNPENMPINS